MLYRTKFPDLPWPPPPNPEKNNVVENPFESDKYVCAECHPYRPTSTLVPSIPPNNDKKNTVELLLSDEEDESNDTSPPVQSLPKDWIKCTTTQVQRKKDPYLPIFYFFNTTTGHTSWVPPMPGGSNASKSTKPIGINKEMLLGTQKNAPSVKGYFHSVRPPTQSFEAALSGECVEEKTVEDVEMKMAAATSTEEAMTEEEKLAASVFTSEYPEKLYMRKEPSLRTKCRELGISGWDTKIKEDLDTALMEHFIEKLGGAAQYHSAFAKKKTFRHNERKECPVQKRKREFAERAAEKLGSEDEEGSTPTTSEKRCRKKILTPKVSLYCVSLFFFLCWSTHLPCVLLSSLSFHVQEAKSKYEHRGIFLVEMCDETHEIRCRCNDKIRSGDDADYNRHFRTQTHQKKEAQWEKERVEQQRMEKYVQAEEEKEDERLALPGTRPSSAHIDDPFRERATKAWLISGNPINRMDKFRGWLQEETGKSLTHSSNLGRKFIPVLLKKERALLKDEFEEVDAVGMIFDATPLQGDFFANVFRRVDLDPDKKRASALQTLVYGSSIEGSLNQHSLSAEVMASLLAAGTPPEKAVVAMNDGCFTNGAAHSNMSKATNISNRLVAEGRITQGSAQRFVVLCISHALSNAGDEAKFVLLSLFWTLVQKTFASSPEAKAIWADTTGKSWLDHSDTRWYSKYDVFELVSNFFGDLLSVVEKIVAKGIAGANS